MTKGTSDNNAVSGERDETRLEPDAEYGDETGSAGSQKLKRLTEKLANCRAERDEYLSGWQRAKADLSNARKEFEEDRGRIHAAARDQFIAELLPVMDSFDMAFSDADAWERVDRNWRRGIEHIHKALLLVFKNHGVEQFGEPGESFDPELHTPHKVVSVNDARKNDTLVSVMQKGYRTKDGVIRPARVAVGEYTEESADENET